MKSGELPKERYDSYLRLRGEVREAKKRNEEAKRIRSRKGHPRRWKG